MKFLIAAKRKPNGVKPIGGVQSWSTTVATELRRRGHTVDFWGPEDPPTEHDYDAGIFANWNHTQAMKSNCIRLLNVSHGIISDEEPSLDLARARRVVFTSEGVKKHWGAPGDIVRQPIDVRFWSPAEQENRAANHLMRYGRGKGLVFLPYLAERKLSMHFFHASHLTHAQARDAMRLATCVIASGRAALEAMAVGVPVLICDHRAKYQDALMSVNAETQMFENYSGRGGVAATSDNVRDGVERAIARGSLREHVLKHHDSLRIVNELLEFFP